MLLLITKLSMLTNTVVIILVPDTQLNNQA